MSCVEDELAGGGAEMIQFLEMGKKDSGSTEKMSPLDENTTLRVGQRRSR